MGKSRHYAGKKLLGGIFGGFLREEGFWVILFFPRFGFPRGKTRSYMVVPYLIYNNLLPRPQSMRGIADTYDAGEGVPPTPPDSNAPN